MPLKRWFPYQGSPHLFLAKHGPGPGALAVSALLSGRAASGAATARRVSTGMVVVAAASGSEAAKVSGLVWGLPAAADPHQLLLRVHDAHVLVRQVAGSCKQCNI